MRALLLTGGILLLIGTLLFGTGSYASIRRTFLTPLIGGAESSSGWFVLASWVGIALMGLGVVVSIVVLFLFTKTMLAPTSYAGRGKDSKSGVGLWSVQSRPQTKPEFGDMVSILKQILEVEYANIVDCPRWFSRLENQALAEKMSSLAQDSMKHFDTCAGLVRQLGGSPGYGFDRQMDETDLEQALQGQFQRERLAKSLYQKATELAAEESTRQKMKAGEAEAEKHIQLLEEVLSALESSETRAGRGDST